MDIKSLVSRFAGGPPEPQPAFNLLEQIDLSPLWEDADDGGLLKQVLPIIGIVVSGVNTLILLYLLFKLS